jgi:hypothetical protein
MTFHFARVTHRRKLIIDNDRLPPIEEHVGPTSSSLPSSSTSSGPNASAGGGASAVCAAGTASVASVTSFRTTKDGKLGAAQRPVTIFPTTLWMGGWSGGPGLLEGFVVSFSNFNFLALSIVIAF